MSIALSRPPAPTVSTTNYLGITASQFRSFATPAISVPFPSVYAQTQIPFQYRSTPTFAATRAASQIGGIPATSGISTALYAAGSKYGQSPNGNGGGGGGSGWPVWATAVIAACGGAAIIVLIFCLWCFCARPSKRRAKRKRQQQGGRYTEKAAIEQRMRSNQQRDYRKNRGGSWFGVSGPPNSNKLQPPPLGYDGARSGRRSRNVPAPIPLDARHTTSEAYGGTGEKAALSTPQRHRFREESNDSDAPLAYDRYEDSPTAWGTDNSPSFKDSPSRAPWLVNGDSNSTLGGPRSGSPRSLPAWVKPERNSLDSTRRPARRNSFSATGTPLMAPEVQNDDVRASLDEPRPERQSLDSPRRSPRRRPIDEGGDGYVDFHHAS